jgi:hypothetical protein
MVVNIAFSLLEIVHIKYEMKRDVDNKLWICPAFKKVF